MIRLSYRIRAGRPARECLWFAADYRNLPAWHPAVRSSRKRTEGAFGVGARFDVRAVIAWREILLNYEVLRFSPPHAATLRGEGPGMTVVDELRVEAEGDDGATLQWTVEINVDRRWQEGLLLPLLPLLRRSAGRAARSLQKALRTEAPARLGFIGKVADRLLLPGAMRFTRQGFSLADCPPVSARAEGRHIAITGATGGLGEAAALALANAGAELTVLGRDTARLQVLQRKLRVDSGSSARIIETDLLHLDQVRRAADALAAGPRLDVLINNAGALFAERVVTAQGIERSLCVNLLAPYLLMQRLLPVMADGGRVINVVSGGMYLTPLQLDDLNHNKDRYDGAVAYGRAKRALALLTAHLARQTPRLALNSMHPGWADTPGVQGALPAFRRVMRPLLRDSAQGADTMVWLALSAAGARSCDGVWFDRAPHPLDVLPATRLSSTQIDALDRQIRAFVGA